MIQISEEQESQKEQDLREINEITVDKYLFDWFGFKRCIVLHFSRWVEPDSLIHQVKESTSGQQEEASRVFLL